MTHKRIIIVGATSGIGLEVARRLAAEGCRLGVAGRKAEVLEQLARQYPGNVVWEHIDVTADDATDHLLRLVGKLGGMDTYLHIAGVGYDNDSLNPQREMHTVETNVVGFTRMVDAAYRYFRDHCDGRGHIAAITSVAGTKGIGHLAAYSASKRYQQTYLMALNQLATIEHLDIRFTDIRPGWVRTPLLNPDEEYPMIMQLPYVARRVIAAVRRSSRVAVIDWRWNLLVGLWRLVPNALWTRIAMPISSLAHPGR